MIYKIAKYCLVVSLFNAIIVLSDDNHSVTVTQQLPPMETFVLEPFELENVSVWIPAVKTGPLINESCRPEKNCSFSCMLPANVHHTKTELCPEGVARLLAEYAAFYHEQSVPLTIFNGWQWEYSYGLWQFESVTYDLPERGGSWENLWEAVLTKTTGSADFQWFLVFPSGGLADKSDSNKQKSHIDVTTFNSIRTRDGYPKKRQF